MKKLFSISLLAALILLVCNCASKTKNLASEEFIYEPLKMENLANVEQNATSFNKAFVPSSGMTECSQIPNQVDINNAEWSYSDHLYSASQAVQIGIPIVGGSGSYSHDKKVFVRDYRRMATCLASNKKTEVYYGQLIRSVIEIEKYDVSAGIDLASIAANGTLHKNSQHFYFYKTGFYNPAIDNIIASVSGKVFDVENYAIYNNVMNGVINLLANPETTFKPQRIGIKEDLTPEGDEDLAKAPIIAYSLSSIAKGKSYNEAIKKFSSIQDNNFATDLVRITYASLMCSADENTPKDEATSHAKKLLQGVKVRN